MPSVPEIVDVLEVVLPPSSRALVVSDLHLEATATVSSTSVASELADVIGAMDGPGAIVLAGDCFELLSGGSCDPVAALDAHPVLASALAQFAAGGAGRHVAFLAGNHDGRLAWDTGAVGGLHERIAGQPGLAIDLVMGPQRVRIEHGHQLDPANAFAHQRDPTDTPLGLHLVTDILPSLETRSGWLADVEHLIDTSAFVRFVASRLVYRRLLPRWWWLLVPLVVALSLKLPLLSSLGRFDSWTHRIVIATVGTAVDIVLVVLALGVILPRLWHRLSNVSLVKRGPAQNDAPRARAAELVAGGYSGYITGHTHRAELTEVGAGFYGNTGCGNEVAHEWPARLGFPPVFLVDRELSFIQLTASETGLTVTLHQARLDLDTGTRLERLLAKRTPAVGTPQQTGQLHVHPSTVPERAQPTP